MTDTPDLDDTPDHGRGDRDEHGRKPPVKIATIEDLTNDALLVYEGLRNKTIDPKEAAAYNKTLGKITDSLKVRLSYHALRGEAPHIPFLSGSTPVGPVGKAPKQLPGPATPTAALPAPAPAGPQDDSGGNGREDAAGS